MDENTFVIMLKEKDTGYLSSELVSFTAERHGECIDRVFAEEENGETVLHIFLSTGRDVADWEFNAVYDYYDETVMASAADFAEAEDCFNPTWELTIPFDENMERLEAQMAEFLELHANELASVFEIIADKEQEYAEQDSK